MVRKLGTWKIRVSSWPFELCHVADVFPIFFSLDFGYSLLFFVVVNIFVVLVCMIDKPEVPSLVSETIFILRQIKEEHCVKFSSSRIVVGAWNS
jgi:hypothetical protein